MRHATWRLFGRGFLWLLKNPSMAMYSYLGSLKVMDCINDGLLERGPRSRFLAFEKFYPIYQISKKPFNDETTDKYEGRSTIEIKSSVRMIAGRDGRQRMSTSRCDLYLGQHRCFIFRGPLNLDIPSYYLYNTSTQAITVNKKPVGYKCIKKLNNEDMVEIEGTGVFMFLLLRSFDISEGWYKPMRRSGGL